MHAIEPVSVTASADDGNVPANTLDDDLSTRWSANGDGVWIQYDLGEIVSIDRIELAFHRGDTRSATFRVEKSDDGAQWMTEIETASSGSTTALEPYTLNASARYFRIVGFGNTSNSWTSLTEANFVEAGVLPPPPPPPPPPAPGPVATASADDGNGASNVLDDDLSTRWSANGNGQWLQLDLGAQLQIGAVDIATYRGDQRSSTFDIELSTNGIDWTPRVLRGVTSGTTIQRERYEFPPLEVRYIRLIGYGNSSNSWNSVTEFAALDCSEIVCLPPCTTEDDCIEIPCELDPDCVPPPPCHLDPNCECPREPVDPNCPWWPIPIPMPDIPAQPTPDLPPHGNFDLGDWYLSVPTDVDGNGKPDDVKEEFLWEGYQNSEFFYITNDGGLVMTCPIRGAKTPNTDYARVELREMLRRGDKQYPTSGVVQNNWVLGTAPQQDIDLSGGTDGSLNATLKVDHVTSTGRSSQVGRVIIGQIHANSNEPLRLYYRKLPDNSRGSIYFAHERRSGGENYYELIGSRSNSAPNPSDGIALGEVFSYSVDVVGNSMRVTIRRSGKLDVSETVDISSYNVGGQYLYFKAGVYNQNNSGLDDDYVSATFYKIENSHVGYGFNQ